MIAIYARQSVDKKDSISIDSQIEFCKREVAEGEEVKVYKDKGYSGKNIERPAFQQLLEDIKKGNITKIIIYRLDRMSRSLLDFASLVDTFNECGVEFVSSTEKFDTSTPIGRAMLSIIMVFAQLERETIAGRIKDNYYERGKKGMFLGGNVPFGYDLSPYTIDGIKTSKLVPNSNSETVRKMYELYANGNMSLGQIAKLLTSEGSLSLYDKAWDSAKISRTIKNPVYVKADADIYLYLQNLGCLIHNDITEFDGEHGLFLFGDKVKTGLKNHQNISGYTVSIAPHKGIIDSKTWLKCATKLITNKQIKNSGKSNYSWLAGLISCGKCNYSMTISKANLSKKYGTYALYFKCSGRAMRRICDADSPRVADIENEVQKQMIERLEYLKSQLNNDISENENNDNSNTVNDLKIRINVIENDIEKLLDSLLAANTVAMDYINKKITKLDEELKKLRLKLNEELSKNKTNVTNILELEYVMSRFDELDLVHKKEVAKAMIQRVYIYDKKPRITWVD